jgi:hypothetical protein
MSSDLARAELAELTVVRKPDEISRDLHDSVADDSHRIEPSGEHQVQQQRMRASTDPTATVWTPGCVRSAAARAASGNIRPSASASPET